MKETAEAYLGQPLTTLSSLSLHILTTLKDRQQWMPEPSPA
jgi:hypothetical protein